MAPAKPAQRSKKYRDKIKEDPEKYQQYLEREKERYKKRKETGKLKAISQLSKGEQRCRRRQWKVNQRNKRASDKNREKIPSYIAGNTPPLSPIGQEEHENEVPILEASPDISDSSHHKTSSQMRGRKIVRANRAKAYRDLAEYHLKLEHALRKVEKYKKRYQRLSEKLTTSESPKMMNEISCFCSAPEECKCYGPQTVAIQRDEPTTSQEGSPLDLQPPEMDTQPSTLVPVSEITDQLIGQWCAIQYDQDVYPGIIQDVDAEGCTLVKTMSIIGKNRFFWPMKDDVLWYQPRDLLGLVPEPQPVTKRHMRLPENVWEMLCSLRE